MSKTSLALIILLIASVSAQAAPQVGEWYPTGDPMPLVLSGVAVGTHQSLTITVERDPATATSASLFLLVDDIDAKREAVITCNGTALPIADSLLGEGAGFKAHLPLAPGVVKQGKNIIDFVFADNLGGQTKGYDILEAVIVLQVDEDSANPDHRRDPDTPTEGKRHDILHNKVVRLEYVNATRTQIGHRGLSFSAIVKLPGGKLIAACSYRLEGSLWRIKLYHSSDNSRTWTQQPSAGEPLVGAKPSISLIGGKQLMLTTVHDGQMRLYQSNDHGINWSLLIAAKDLPLSRDVVSLNNSPAILRSSGTYFNRDARPGKAWLLSGGDFMTKSTVAAWTGPEPMFDEASVVVLGSGALVATGRVTANTRPHPMAWTYDANISPSDSLPDHTILSRSSDSGKTWQTQHLTEDGQIHAHLLVLKDGRLLCTYAQYVQPYGIYAILSTDGGQTWQTKTPYRLAASLDANCGWPTSVELDDGSILTCHTIRPFRDHSDNATLDQVTDVVRWRVD